MTGKPPRGLDCVELATVRWLYEDAKVDDSTVLAKLAEHDVQRLSDLTPAQAVELLGDAA